MANRRATSQKTKIISCDWQTVREIASALPGAEEGTSYGTPAFKVKGKLFVRFHQSGESVVISIEIDQREQLMKMDPESFYITEHYTKYPWMLVRLATIGRDNLEKMIEESWRRNAPKKLVESLIGSE
ncbi:MAG TPA: MmcQ/YjbR family DNA-binding protein [Blastocatellia bacterium]|nr:MmcQ/YjbR family DNA-binding protein [Blastocatellia bacterium]